MVECFVFLRPLGLRLVLIGWAEAGWLSLGFGAVLMVTIIGTIIYLVQLKVFQAVKLGETI